MNRRNFIKSALSALALVPISLGIKQAAKTWHLKPGDSLSDAVKAAQPGDTIHLDSGEYAINGHVTFINCTLTGNGPSANMYSSIDFQDYSF